MNKATFNSYLTSWSDPGVPWNLIGPLVKNHTWQTCFVIPARAEHPYLVETLKALAKSSFVQTSKVLVVIVLNVDSSTSREDLNLHQRSLEALHLSTPIQLQVGHFPFDVLALDFSGATAFHPQDGVGRARKIGGDLACHLRARGHLQSSFYFSTDADVLWPKEFSTESFPSHFAALCLEFTHDKTQGDSFEQRAIQLYERFLMRHREGLEQAGSPYAFYTLGSNLVIDLEVYAKVRGFPIRNAGEDFYFLNKVAKLGPVLHHSEQAPLLVSGRASHRVPFGTGASVSQIAQRLKNGKAFKVYDSRVYEVLKSLLEQLEDLASTGDRNTFWNTQRPYRGFWLRHEAKINTLLDQAKSCERRHQALKEYFDAFLTLKWIHYLTETRFPRQELF